MATFAATYIMTAKAIFKFKLISQSLIAIEVSDTAVVETDVVTEVEGITVNDAVVETIVLVKEVL